MLNKPVWISCADQNRDAAVYLRKEFVWEQNDCNAVICGFAVLAITNCISMVNGWGIGNLILWFLIMISVCVMWIMRSAAI